jgi:hypothetical protein
MPKPNSNLVQIPHALALAAARYYLNKNKQYNIQAHVVNSNGKAQVAHTVTVNKGSWNKEADVDNFFNISDQFGYCGGSACAGTFWFQKGSRVYELSENTWPLAKSMKIES